ncbi:hypothetical protein Pla110_15990 [Polystyrenella longa]|uniref:Peptidase C-terminal archaeal/bacterial domain-containing protein n=1 Tax=Polystyrenella longa TaxID=2528007 RepID=A0A518CKY6_9PLAN|nr:PPC domain-containing protein [Polystyrenella longa]QDU79879.1 hypothetical protein Pla110_15990 [Polystyrenella longa]
MNLILQMMTLCIVLSLVSFFGSAEMVFAQTPPGIGYMYPPGGQAGQTIDVVLGGYDWTPDMQLFVHDERIQLEILSPPGPVIVPEPPYWFGKKARRSPTLLPRETPARLTIPADISPGVVSWQAANANGGTATGKFIVSDGPELVEIDDREQAQKLPSLPVSISGHIKKIEEVDRYQFVAEKSGPVTCSIAARKIDSPLNAALEVHDATGQKIAEAVDTAGIDTAITFPAQAQQTYTVSVYDIDFRGNRSFVYRLSIVAAPRVVAAIPAAGQRGRSQSVEFVGYGISTGASILESVTRTIDFPADPSLESFHYRLETPFGSAPAFSMLLSDQPESVEADNSSLDLTGSVAVTGVLNDRLGKDVYHFVGKKGDQWNIDLVAEKIASPLDVTLTVLGAEGKVLASSDDVPGSTDAALQFTVPADGEYSIDVTDVSGQSGNAAAVYRLTMEPAQPAFTLDVPEILNAPLGENVKFSIKAKRLGGFKEPISISFNNLPLGVTVPDELIIPAKASALKMEFTVSPDEAATASMVTVVGQAKIDDQNTIQSTAGPLLMATTIPPPFSIDAEGKDDVTKWPRGTTFPAPVLIQRDEGFQEEIVLEMTSRQGRHRQGIRGPELTVPPGIERILYPIFLPEWLETTRTSRLVLNGVAKVTDPKGNIRYSLTRQKTRMGFLPTGALLSISADVNELKATSEKELLVPLIIRRSPKLTEPVRLELLAGSSKSFQFNSEPMEVAGDQTETSFPITMISSDGGTTGESKLTIRATVLQDGTLPVVAETTVIVLSGQ